MRIKMIILGVVFTCFISLLINTELIKLELNKVYFSATCPVPRQGGNPIFYAQFYEDYILSIAFFFCILIIYSLGISIINI